LFFLLLRDVEVDIDFFDLVLLTLAPEDGTATVLLRLLLGLLLLDGASQSAQMNSFWTMIERR
jgi:hypothetical protein